MIRLECNTWEELIELIGTILNTETAKNDKKLQKTDRNEQKPAETVANTAPAPTPAAPVPANAAPKAVTRQDVQVKAIALMDAGKQAQLQALLVKYGVPALPALPEDRLADFMADLGAV